MEGTTEGVLLVLQDRPVYANKTLLSRLGYTEEELVQVPLDKIIESVANGGPAAPADGTARQDHQQARRGGGRAAGFRPGDDR